MHRAWFVYRKEPVQMRIRAFFVTAVLALGIIAPATASGADVCYDLDVVLNGDVVVDESDCIEA